MWHYITKGILSAGFLLMVWNNIWIIKNLKKWIVAIALFLMYNCFINIYRMFKKLSYCYLLKRA